MIGKIIKGLLLLIVLVIMGVSVVGLLINGFNVGATVQRTKNLLPGGDTQTEQLLEEFLQDNGLQGSGQVQATGSIASSGSIIGSGTTSLGGTGTTRTGNQDNTGTQSGNFLQEDIVGESNEPLDPYEALLQKRLEHYQAFKKNNYQEVDSSTQTDQDATPTSNAEKTEISDEKTQEAEAILDAISPETILPGSDKPDTSLIDESFTPDTDSTPESQENSDNEFGPIETIEG